MSRTRRTGWTEVTGSDTVTDWKTGREKRHQATNDWFSKKNACRGSSDDSWDEYWGRDKKRVKQITRRRNRRNSGRDLYDGF